MVDIAALVFDDSPRTDGEDPSHTQTLAETDGTLPPIVVHRQTMRVIDGMHRVQAARIKGRTKIAAVYFDGDAEAAFVKAVETNVSHGLPLSLRDRKVAAQRIMKAYPTWSDRAIGAATGLSATTVRTIRDSVDASAQSSRRVGRDGRVRPLSAAEGRRRAAAVFAQRPEAPLREVAGAAGISVATARDVRNRLREGEDSVPAAVRRAEATDAPENGVRRAGVKPRTGDPLGAVSRPPSSLLDALKKDPSLRYSERGRHILRWLDAHVLDSAVTSLPSPDDVPPHCRYTIAELAIGCARAWEQLAAALRSHTDGP